MFTLKYEIPRYMCDKVLVAGVQVISDIYSQGRKSSRAGIVNLAPRHQIGPSTYCYIIEPIVVRDANTIDSIKILSRFRLGVDKVVQTFTPALLHA